MKAQFGREWLEEEYLQKHRSLRDMGRECNVSRETVRTALRDAGIEYVPPRKKIDVAWVRKQVEGKGRSFRSVARELGVSHLTISKVCRDNGIQMGKGSRGGRPRS
jgi:transposase